MAVPATRLARVSGFAGLAVGLAANTLRERVARAWRGDAGGAPEKGLLGADATPFHAAVLSESNAERLAVALCRMRGAALKLGQLLSIQDESVVPPHVQQALERVRQGADVMPQAQLEPQLVAELGAGWRDRLASFDEEPMAAASIGQVHRATARDGTDVVLKIQYPGVAESIHSDVDNLLRLVTLTDLLPKGLYIEHAVEVAKAELSRECDYRLERASQERFGELLRGDADYHVPAVRPELCSERVLCSEFARGIPIDKVVDLPQEERDHVGRLLLRLTLRELFQLRFMQTDPNFANFLYDRETRRLVLIDFGSCSDFPRPFVDDYLRMVRGCADRDSDAVVGASVRLGFLTGDESKAMMDAHTQAGFIVGDPFAEEGEYDFGVNSGMTRRVSELGKTMLKDRLTPPPQEAYMLHRKLSGAFLTCMKIRARVPCRDMLLQVWDEHEFGDSPEHMRAAEA